MSEPSRLDFRSLQPADKRLLIDTGQRDVDRFLRDKALKLHTRFHARTQVAVDDKGAVLAYYCLLPHGEPVNEVGKQFKSNTQQYSITVPCIQLAWMGVRKDCQRASDKKLRYGEQTLVHAIVSAKTSIEAAGAYALQLEAASVEAEAFFAAYGFQPYTDDNTKRLLLPAAEVVEAAAIFESTRSG